MTQSRTNRRSFDELPRILVVDDEADIRELIDLTLSRMGFAADCVGTVSEAYVCLERTAYVLCLTDMRLPDGEGLDVVRYIAERHGEVPVAVITAYGSMENAVVALKAGAFDYLAKPVGLEQLRSLVKAVLNVPAKGEKTADGHAASPMIGVSSAMEAVRQMIAKVARSQAPVYVSGESGTGKELAARMIHAQSPRNAGPFIAVNCGAIPENLMESEFFGYRKGAFTGADTDRDGFFQVVAGGTLFLDEVADLPLPMQVKLLRAIQEKSVRKVGSPLEEPVDIRVISATHKNLLHCVEKGEFRQDLYYRLNVIELKLPPLRERREDVPILAKNVLIRLGAGVRNLQFSAAAEKALLAYPFPGNVRELENVLERASALCSDDLIEVDDLQLAPVSIALDENDKAGAGMEGETLDDYVNRIEKKVILDALSKTNNNRTAAAQLLGITFRSLRYRIERLGIDP